MSEEVLYYPLDPGRTDSENILVYLNQFAVQFGREPQVRLAAEQLLPSTLYNNDIAGQVNAVTAFVKDRVKYLADPEGTEFVRSPLNMLNDIANQGFVYGDCDDHCLLWASLLRSLGLDAQIIGVKQDEQRSQWFDHVIGRVPYNGRWVELDLCCKGSIQPQYKEKLIVT